MNLITLARLDSANISVTRELERLGLYDGALQEVDTYLVPFGGAYGWQHYGRSGNIKIPCVSLSKMMDLWFGRYTSLRDVLRHEFGHAFADTHRGLFRSHRFRDAFGACHGWSIELDFDLDHHVSVYSASASAEDFAEVFMIYVRSAGRLPASLCTRPIRRKWGFIEQLRDAVERGARRW